MRALGNSARSATLTETKEHQPRDAGMIALLSAVLTLVALAFCSQHQLLLLYGDAVAHLHIARRLFDSRTPGFRQLGSVWLPLPHLLLVPFVLKMSWWQSGVAAALPSSAGSRRRSPPRLPCLRSVRCSDSNQRSTIRSRTASTVARYQS